MAAYKLLVVFSVVLHFCSALNEHNVLPEIQFKTKISDNLKLEAVSEIIDKKEDLNDHIKYSKYDEEALAPEMYESMRYRRGIGIPPPHSGSTGPYNPLPSNRPLIVKREIFENDNFHNQIRQKREPYTVYQTRISKPTHFPIPTTPLFHQRYKRNFSSEPDVKHTNLENHDSSLQNKKEDELDVLIDTDYDKSQVRDKRKAYVSYRSSRPKNPTNIQFNIPTTPPFHQRYRRNINNESNLKHTNVGKQDSSLLNKEEDEPDVLIDADYNKPQTRDKRKAYVSYPSSRPKNPTNIQFNIPTTPPFHQRYKRNINNETHLEHTNVGNQDSSLQNKKEKEPDVLIGADYNKPQTRDKRKAYVSYPSSRSKNSKNIQFNIPTTPPFHQRHRRNINNESDLKHTNVGKQDSSLLNKEEDEPDVLIDVDYNKPQTRDIRSPFLTYPTLPDHKNPTNIQFNILTTNPFRQRFGRGINGETTLNRKNLEDRYSRLSNDYFALGRDTQQTAFNSIPTKQISHQKLLTICYCVRYPCTQCYPYNIHLGRRKATLTFMPSRDQNGYIIPYDYRRPGQFKLNHVN